MSVNNLQVFGANEAGSSVGQNILPNGTSYTAWTQIGTSLGAINMINFQPLYTVLGTDLFADIGLGPSGAVIPVVEAVRFNTVGTNGIGGPLFIPPNTPIWVRFIQQSSVATAASFSLTGWWDNDAPIVTHWYVCGMVYGTATGSPAIPSGASAFGTPVQLSTPAGRIKRLWISIGNLSAGPYVIGAFQLSLGPSGAQKIACQISSEGPTYRIGAYHILEIDIPPSVPMWGAFADQNFGVSILAALN